MAKPEKQDSTTPTPQGGDVISKFEIPIPRDAIKTGVRLAFDFKDTKVRLTLTKLPPWS